VGGRVALEAREARDIHRYRRPAWVAG